MSEEDFQRILLDITELENKLREIQHNYFDKKLALSENELHKLEKEMEIIKIILMEKEEKLSSLKFNQEKSCSSFEIEYKAPPEILIKKRIIPVNENGEPTKDIRVKKFGR